MQANYKLFRAAGLNATRAYVAAMSLDWSNGLTSTSPFFLFTLQHLRTATAKQVADYRATFMQARNSGEYCDARR